MGVPTTITDLSTTIASNSPAGSDTVTTNTGPDEYFRAINAIVRREQAQATDAASAATVDLGAIANGNYVKITGVTTITAFGTVAAGIERTVVFTGALLLTHNATSLILPGAVNITTAAGDAAVFRSEGSGNWKCTAFEPYTVTGTGSGVRAASPTFTGTVVFPSGQALIAPALGTPASGNLANCTFPTLNQNTTGNAGTATTATGTNALYSATTTVNVSSATAPTEGQVLKATSGTAATWQSGIHTGNIAFPATQVPSADPNTLDDYDEYTAANTACTGALTVNAIWKLVKVGNIVTLTLPKTVQTSPTAASAFNYGVKIPAKYVPSGLAAGGDTAYVVVIRDNGALLNQPGYITLVPDLGEAVIAVYKSPAGANWTATGEGGLLQTSISWVI